MTGTRAPAWNWLHRVVLPALWAAAETTVVCLWMRGVVNTSPDFRMRLPYASFALGAAAAAALTGLTGRFRWPWWRRVLVLTPLVLVGLAVTAGLTTGVSMPHLRWTAMASPWDVAGSAARQTTGTAWFVAIAVWARGVSLGFAEPTFIHIRRAAGIGATGFVLLFLAQAGDDPAFNRATRSSGPLFVLFVAGAAVTVGLLRERDLQWKLLRQPASLPSLAWLGVLALPMAAVTLVALAVALAGGPLGEPAGQATEGLASGVGAVIGAGGAAVDWVLNRFGGSSGSGSAPSSGGGSQVPSALRVVFEFVVAFAVFGLLLAAISLALTQVWLHRPAVALRRGVRPAARQIVEERRWRFSWRRLFAQTWALICRMFGKILRRSTVSGPAAPATGEGTLPAGPPVRGEYRQVLVAASRRGVGRQWTETVREFEERLSSHLDEGASAQLRRLTDLYTDVRYGARPPGPEDRHEARSAAEQVILGLEEDAPSRS